MKQMAFSKNDATDTSPGVSAADAVENEEAEAKEAKDGAVNEEDRAVGDTALRSGAAGATEELHMVHQENNSTISFLRPNNNNSNNNNSNNNNRPIRSINCLSSHNQGTTGQYLQSVPAALQPRWTVIPWDLHPVFGVRKTKSGCGRSPRHQPEHQRSTTTKKRQ
jgi:hypothetical protein